MYYLYNMKKINIELTLLLQEEETMTRDELMEWFHKKFMEIDFIGYEITIK